MFRAFSLFSSANCNIASIFTASRVKSGAEWATAGLNHTINSNSAYEDPLLEDQIHQSQEAQLMVQKSAELLSNAVVGVDGLCCCSWEDGKGGEARCNHKPHIHKSRLKYKSFEYFSLLGANWNF